jgi:hypothetical protein
MRIKAIGVALLFLAVTILSAATVSAGEGKLLRGDVWQGMTPDEKVAFLWGAGQVVLVENEIMAQMPELKVENFSAKVAEAGSDNIILNDLVVRIDNFYETYPENNSMPVIRVIWDTTIKPNIKTGIGGRPLN